MSTRSPCVRRRRRSSWCRRRGRLRGTREVHRPPTGSTAADAPVAADCRSGALGRRRTSCSAAPRSATGTARLAWWRSTTRPARGRSPASRATGSTPDRGDSCLVAERGLVTRYHADELDATWAVPQSIAGRRPAQPGPDRRRTARCSRRPRSSPATPTPRRASPPDRDPRRRRRRARRPRVVQAGHRRQGRSHRSTATSGA